ncbi:uncharacterized protein NFIA_088970 [Aspergillus fischeri NRRL 181]|uniref:F-box domain protein n=1 Tax=Neosartorya fischeri (strain ATCC 1020 / DSM 3700 / CBS 544.65 / FGSC A1164 / JCM 1740 / NRRL 181 / WB 181) TaxID=331117 RepID=A1DHT4_NEOFI|nr:conserved hypothetical protein [Aspergillus fischeri NRRL 181]EAW18941.1 conserved hypothetical protein [Aspergillus fischeri NRRL 181]
MSPHTSPVRDVHSAQIPPGKVARHRGFHKGIWDVTLHLKETTTGLKKAIERLGFESVEKQEKILNMLQAPAIMYDDDPRSPFLAQALAALLVSVSPMLDSLSFCPVGYEAPKLLRLEAEADGEPLPMSDYVFKHFLELASMRGKDMPFLQNLRAVRFLVDPNTDVYHSTYYQPYGLFISLNLVRRLPAVESIRMDAIADANLPSVEPPPRSGNYTCITIQHSSLSYPYLVYIIESAKRLEKFTYGIGGHSSWNGMLTPFHPEHVFRALFVHRASLRQLDLDVEEETRILDLDSDNLRYLQYTPEEEEHESPRDDPVYLHEWADELEKLPAEDESTADDCSLRNFLQLEDLSLGVHILYLYARGYGGDQVDNGSFSLVDHLPPNLVSLRIYGYKKGMKPRLKGVSQNSLEEQLAKLMAEKDEKLPRLAVVEGIEEPIPNGETIEGPMNKDKLWKGDADEDWTVYEYA